MLYLFDYIFCIFVDHTLVHFDLFGTLWYKSHATAFAPGLPFPTVDVDIEIMTMGSFNVNLVERALKMY